MGHSILDATLDAVNTLIESALVATYPNITTVKEAVDPNNIKTENLPHCQMVGIVRNTSEFLVFRQAVQELGFICLMHFSDVTQDDLLEAIESIESELATDPRLADSVEWCYVSGFTLQERAHQSKISTLVFEVVCELIGDT